MQNLGMKKDWGVSLNGQMPTFDYEVSLTRGSGVELDRFHEDEKTMMRSAGAFRRLIRGRQARSGHRRGRAVRRAAGHRGHRRWRRSRPQRGVQHSGSAASGCMAPRVPGCRRIVVF